MKKYISSATKWLLVLSLISVIILTTGIALIVGSSSNILLQIGITAFGGLMSILFLSCYFAEKSRALVIDADKIIFPRGADKNGKMVFQKTVVKPDDISSIESELYKGSKIVSDDCYFHTLVLKDGTEITVTLYAYGKEAEKEILEIIQSIIVQAEKK